MGRLVCRKITETDLSTPKFPKSDVVVSAFKLNDSGTNGGESILLLLH